MDSDKERGLERGREGELRSERKTKKTGRETKRTCILKD